MKQHEIDRIVACIVALCIMSGLIFWIIKSHGSIISIIVTLIVGICFSSACHEMENPNNSDDCGGADV